MIMISPFDFAGIFLFTFRGLLLYAVVAQAERRPVKAGHIDDTQERPYPACPRMD